MTLLTPVRCIAWNARLSAIAIGQNPQLSFFALDAQQVLAHKRARNRQVSIAGKHALPEPVWLRDGYGSHFGTQKLAQLRAQEEAKRLAEPTLHMVSLFLSTLLHMLAQ